MPLYREEWGIDSRGVQGEDENALGYGGISMRYTCSLNFGAIEVDGIEASNESEAKSIAMKTFRPAIESIDENSIRVAVREKKMTPLISFKFDVSKRKKKLTDTKIAEKRCKEIARIADKEIGVK